jgi:hypothetical protein
MKILSAVVMLAIASILAGIPALADPPANQASNCPIRIDDSNLVPEIDEDNPFNPGGFAEITFTNVGSAPVTDVAFKVENPQGNVMLVITDHGNFSPGAHIDHKYSMPLSDHRLHVVVARVIFANGDTWYDSSAGQGPN